MTAEAYRHAFLGRDRLVHILDPDPSTCEALSVLFRLEGFRTSFSIDAASFFPAIERRWPDVVVLNHRLGSGDGLTVLSRIKTMQATTPVFVIEDEPRVEAVVQAMKAGASDVVAKPIDTDYLVAAVRGALELSVGAITADNLRGKAGPRRFEGLTPREREVLELVAGGRSNKEAGRALGISPRTVEVHRARVMEKLGARNTAHLIRIVLTA